MARQESAAVAIGGKVIVAGGRANGPQAAVDVYDSSLGSPANPAAWSIKTLSVARGDPASTVVGQYALFAGGTTSFTTSTAVVEVYDAQTGQWSTATLSAARFGIAATTVGTKAIFAGGAAGGPGNAVASAVVDIYDSSLGTPSNPLAWSTATLSVARGNIGAASAATQAIFAGGFDGTSAANAVDIYDDSTGTWSTAVLSEARMPRYAAIGIGTKAYFPGGMTNTGPSAVVDIYDAQTGLWTINSLALARSIHTVTAVGNTVFVAGGNSGATFPGTMLDSIEVLDTVTGTWAPMKLLSQARQGLCSTRLGSMAFFAGGFGVAGASAVVDILDTCPPATTYCSAKLNSLGCAPSISATGAASATALAGFVVSAVNVLNQKSGLLVYSTTGQAATPFQGGFLCVAGPVRRTIAVSSGGSPQPVQDCTGVYAIDMNAFAAGALGGSPLPALSVAGTVVSCQWWGRDPGLAAPNNTTLSNGLTYSVCP